MATVKVGAAYVQPEFYGAATYITWRIKLLKSQNVTVRNVQVPQCSMLLRNVTQRTTEQNENITGHILLQST
jgi:hypothetical protein